MKILKLIIISIVLFVILHVVTLFALSDVKILPCQIKPVVADMERVEWQDSKCDINYKHWFGSVQKLTPVASAARIGLIYVLPLLVTSVIVYGLCVRKRRVEV